MSYVMGGLCAVLAGIFLYAERKKKYVSAVILKGLASLCFVIAGVLSNQGAGGSKPIIAGLVIGCIADVLLNLRFVFQKKGQAVFLVGILVFLSGHVAYLAAVLPMSSNQIACVIIGIVLTALLMVWILRQITAKPAFKIFGIVYIGAITMLNSVAIGNLITAPSAFTGVFAVGAVLFLISDVVLILNTFGGKFRQSLRIANIGLYYAGQLLIAFSLQWL